LSDAEIKGLANLGERHSLGALQRMLQILMKASDDMAHSRHERMVLEMAIIRSATVHDMETIPEVLNRLEAMEQRLVSGGTVVEAAPAPKPQAQKPVLVQNISEIATDVDVLVSVPEPAPEPTVEPAPAAAPPSEPVVPVAEPATALTEPAAAPVAVAVATPHPEPVALAPEPGPAAVELAPTGDLRWTDLVTAAKSSDPLLASMLEHAQVLQLDSAGLRLGYSASFYFDQLSTGSNHDRLKELIVTHYGSGRTLKVEMVEENRNTLAAEQNDRDLEQRENQRQEVIDHPVTQAVLSTMQGELVDVRVEDNDE